MILNTVHQFFVKDLLNWIIAGVLPLGFQTGTENFTIILSLRYGHEGETCFCPSVK